MKSSSFVGALWSITARRIDQALGAASLEIACDRGEQLMARRELGVPPGDQVLETTDKRIGRRIAAHSHHVRGSTRVVQGHLDPHAVPSPRVSVTCTMPPCTCSVMGSPLRRNTFSIGVFPASTSPTNRETPFSRAMRTRC